MNLRLIIFGCAGILATLVAMSKCTYYNVPKVKMLIFSIVAVSTGFFGIKLYGFLETGSWAGMRILGSILIVPFVLALLSKIIKIPYWKLLDLHAVTAYLMLAIMKIDCFRAGCCSGIALWYDSQYNIVYFPSAIVESFVNFSIWGFLIYLECKGNSRGKLCGIGLIVYCISRIPLEMLRAEQLYFSWGWYSTYTGCILGILLGIFLIKYMNKHNPNLEHLTQNI